MAERQAWELWIIKTIQLRIQFKKPQNFYYNSYVATSSPCISDAKSTTISTTGPTDSLKYPCTTLQQIQTFCNGFIHRAKNDLW